MDESFNQGKENFISDLKNLHFHIYNFLSCKATYSKALRLNFS